MGYISNNFYLQQVLNYQDSIIVDRTNRETIISEWQ